MQVFWAIHYFWKSSMVRLGVKLNLSPRKSEPFFLKEMLGRGGVTPLAKKQWGETRWLCFLFLGLHKHRQALQIFDLALPISASQTKHTHGAWLSKRLSGKATNPPSKSTTSRIIFLMFSHDTDKLYYSTSDIHRKRQQVSTATGNMANHNGTHCGQHLVCTLSVGHIIVLLLSRRG